MCMHKAITKESNPREFGKRLKKLERWGDGFLVWKVVSWNYKTKNLIGPFRWVGYERGPNTAEGNFFVDDIGRVFGGVFHCKTTKEAGRRYKNATNCLIGVIVDEKDILCFGLHDEIGVRKMTIHPETYDTALKQLNGFWKKQR